MPIFETLPAAKLPLAAQIATAPIRAPNSMRLVVANSPSLWLGRPPLVRNRHILQDHPIDATMSNRSRDRPAFARAFAPIDAPGVAAAGVRPKHDDGSKGVAMAGMKETLSRDVAFVRNETALLFVDLQRQFLIPGLEPAD